MLRFTKELLSKKDVVLKVTAVPSHMLSYAVAAFAVELIGTCRLHLANPRRYREMPLTAVPIIKDDTWRRVQDRRLSDASVPDGGAPQVLDTQAARQAGRWCYRGPCTEQ